jgi:hypothetical protein
VIDQLDDYHARGVRAIFPVHKYDNGFSAGDGHKQIIELGNFIQTGHFSNFTPECDAGVPSVFDKGPAAFPGLNQPRADYFAPPPNDFSGFADDPLGTLSPFLASLLQPRAPGGLPGRGMTRSVNFSSADDDGRVLEIDHLPRRSYQRSSRSWSRTTTRPRALGLNSSGALTGSAEFRAGFDAAASDATAAWTMAARPHRADRNNGGFQRTSG